MKIFLNQAVQFFYAYKRPAMIASTGCAILFFLTKLYNYSTKIDGKGVADRSFTKGKDSPEINSIVSKVLEKNWIYKLPKKPAFIIDTDVGNDPDDVLAHIYAARAFGSQIRLISTTLYRPEEKARISKLVFSQMGFPDKTYP